MWCYTQSFFYFVYVSWQNKRDGGGRVIALLVQELEGSLECCQFYFLEESNNLACSFSRAKNTEPPNYASGEEAFLHPSKQSFRKLPQKTWKSVDSKVPKKMYRDIPYFVFQRRQIWLMSSMEYLFPYLERVT